MHISRDDCRLVDSCITSHDVFETLRKTHQKRGPHAKMLLLNKAMSIRYQPDVPLATTREEIESLFTRIVNMGPFNDEQLRQTLHLQALADNYQHIHQHLMNLADDPSFSSNTIIRRIHHEEDLLRHRSAQSTSTVALATQARPPTKSRPSCTHCKKVGHAADFCIQPGGKMAGRSLEDAKTAQRAASNKAPKPSGTATANVASSDAGGAPLPSISTPDTIVINGVTYSATPAQPAQPSTASVAVVQPLQPDSLHLDDSAGAYPFHSYLAFSGPTRVSVDWSCYSCPPSKAVNDFAPMMTSSSRAFVAHVAERPFILDSGASNHISPERSDFRNLRPIPPHPIQGFNGSSTNAIGMGDIDLCIGSGHKLSLKDVLFVPDCSTRLVSVFALARDGYNFVTFGPEDCWISDKHNKIIVRGSVASTKGLYLLNCQSARVTHNRPPSPLCSSTALYSKRIPDLETWHRRLGHCNNQRIVDMARNKVVTGMTIDLSSSPPTCDACILGKQTRSPVPRVREGLKATSPLERVYVDLCGPMPVVSKSGHSYSMNVIDDFSSYVWSLPLKRKSDAATILRGWHRAVENQSNHKLKILVTDNGELVSQSMADWCTSLGIDHQRTAPYTSAQNGRAERLHRTILNKARAMRLACNAPASLWDEFCATAAYLMNLTGSSSIDGKTPHELWFGRSPSLSHLREIGCRAFSLIQTHNPKLYRRSTPCTLIGYAPNSKAYRLWDNTSGRIFNSFHVSFIEHLQEQSSALLPGTTVILDPDAPPSWDVPCPDPVPLPSNSTPPLHQFPVRPSITHESQSQHEQLPPTSETPIAPIPTSIDSTPPSFPPSPPTSTAPSPSHPLSPAVRPTPPPSRIPLRIRIPGRNPDAPPPPLRRSERIAQLTHPNATALLSRFSPIRDSHDLIHLSIADPSLDVDYVLSALADGSMEPTLDTGDDPSWAEALASSDKEYWIAGAREELKSLKDLQVFVLVPRSSLPPGRRPMRGKLVCKRKRDDSGQIVHYKVRYVAKGYAQIYGIDYDRTTAPTARLESFRTILHLAASLGWNINQFDIKTAFLHGVLPADEIAYMEQPPGFAEPGKEDWVMQLSKSIYGMKQASRIWNQTFHTTVKSWGFERMKNEWCVYRRVSPAGTTIFAVHVDDILCASSSQAELDRFRNDLLSCWEISDLGPAKFALGIAISRDLTSKTISLSQSAYIDRMLERFNMTDAHPCDTPMVAGLQLLRPDSSLPVDPHITTWMQRTPYRELVGSLNYLAVATRPDIAYAVGRLASFLDCYREEHWNAAQHVLRYIKGTRSLSLTLGGDFSLSLAGFADSDYANCRDTSRSISGYCFSLGSGMISWSSKKQKHATDSSCYAEYIALHHANKETVFLRELLEGLGFPPDTSTPLKCDNDAARRLVGDQSNHVNVKHFCVKYHTTRDLVDEGIVHIVRIPSADNVADIFTKALARPTFINFRDLLGLKSPASPSA